MFPFSQQASIAEPLRSEFRREETENQTDRQATDIPSFYNRPKEMMTQHVYMKNQKKYTHLYQLEKYFR
jgi:hypothetical protein